MNRRQLLGYGLDGVAGFIILYFIFQVMIQYGAVLLGGILAEQTQAQDINKELYALMYKTATPYTAMVIIGIVLKGLSLLLVRYKDNSSKELHRMNKAVSTISMGSILAIMGFYHLGTEIYYKMPNIKMAAENKELADSMLKSLAPVYSAIVFQILLGIIVVSIAMIKIDKKAKPMVADEH